MLVGWKLASSCCCCSREQLEVFPAGCRRREDLPCFLIAVGKQIVPDREARKQLWMFGEAKHPRHVWWFPQEMIPLQRLPGSSRFVSSMVKVGFGSIYKAFKIKE